MRNKLLQIDNPQTNTPITNNRGIGEQTNNNEGAENLFLLGNFWGKKEKLKKKIKTKTVYYKDNLKLREELSTSLKEHCDVSCVHIYIF